MERKDLNPVEFFKGLFTDIKNRGLLEKGDPVYRNISKRINAKAALVLAAVTAVAAPIAGSFVFSASDKPKPVASASGSADSSASGEKPDEDPMIEKLVSLGVSESEIKRFKDLESPGNSKEMLEFNKRIVEVVYVQWYAELKKYVDSNPKTGNNLNLARLLQYWHGDGKMLFYGNPKSGTAEIEKTVPRFRGLADNNDFTVASTNFSSMEIGEKGRFKKWVFLVKVPFYDPNKSILYFPGEVDGVNRIFAWIALHDIFSQLVAKDSALSATRIMLLFESDLPEGFVASGFTKLLGHILVEQSGADVVRHFTASPEEIVKKTADFLQREYSNQDQIFYMRLAFLAFRSLADAGSDKGSTFHPELVKSFKQLVDNPDLIVENWPKS